jgi:hypothetical protein
MRTTVTLDDEVYRAAKAHAALTGQSVGSVIEDALRDLLAGTRAPSGYVPAIPRAETGLHPGVDYTDTSALLDLTEEDRPVDARR